MAYILTICNLKNAIKKLKINYYFRIKIRTFLKISLNLIHKKLIKIKEKKENYKK